LTFITGPDPNGTHRGTVAMQTTSSSRDYPLRHFFIVLRHW